jgi:hypothetical protein
MEVFLGEQVPPMAQAVAAAHLAMVKQAALVLKQVQTEFFLPSTELIFTGLLAVGETLITRVLAAMVD